MTDYYLIIIEGFKGENETVRGPYNYDELIYEAKKECKNNRMRSPKPLFYLILNGLAEFTIRSFKDSELK